LLHEQEWRAQAGLRRGNLSWRYLYSPLIVFPVMARPSHSTGDVRDLFTHGRQLKHLVFDDRIVSLLGKLPILGPDRLLPLGDVICRFNPAFGQGMSVAAQEVGALNGGKRLHL
jgi:hypothetical protein